VKLFNFRYSKIFVFILLILALITIFFPRKQTSEEIQVNEVGSDFIIVTNQSNEKIKISIPTIISKLISTNKEYFIMYKHGLFQKKLYYIEKA